jgi:hypothetical protein
MRLIVWNESKNESHTHRPTIHVDHATRVYAYNNNVRVRIDHDDGPSSIVCAIHWLYIRNESLIIDQKQLR